MIAIRTSLVLLEHLRSHELDGATVASALFDGGRLSYPGRKDIEHQLGYTEPYTLELEARVIEGMPPRTVASVRYLAYIATEAHRGFDLTLDLLWGTHHAYHNRKEGPSLDRLVAALVAIEDLRLHDISDEAASVAASRVILHLHTIGLPPTKEGLEELFDGADPACVGLGMVQL